MRHTYDEVNEFFSKNGCELISRTYKNNKAKLDYIAQCGHQWSMSLDNFRKGKGRICKDCLNKKASKRRTLPYKYVKDYFESNGCRLLSEKYDDAHKKLEYIASCGHKNYICFNKFQQGGGRVCNKCSKSIRYEYDYVAEAFENKGCVLLETDYINCKTKMRYIAQCGHESEITFDAFLNADSMALRCPECQKINHYDVSKVQRIIKDRGCTLLSNTYVDRNASLEYIASCGHNETITLDKFLAGHGTLCKKCALPKAERHFNYNPDLTDEDRQRRDMQNGEFRIIRRKAFSRDGYKCSICGDSRGGNLVAHHLESWNMSVDKRFELDNLVTLCESCHKMFHQKYGFGYNTEEQYKEFVGLKEK